MTDKNRIECLYLSQEDLLEAGCLDLRLAMDAAEAAMLDYRAGKILARTVLGEIQPELAWRTLPLVLGGGTTIDLFPTMRPIFRQMKRVERHSDVLDTSLLTCHLWAKHDELGWATLAMTDGNADLAAHVAEDLADRAWSVRHVQPPEFSSAEEAIATVRADKLRRKLGTTCVCDASDIVGAGAAGENPRLLEALIRDARDLVSYVPLRDEHAIELLADHRPGETVNMHIGGKSSDEDEPLDFEGVLVRRAQHDVFGRMVVLKCGGVHVIITERQPLAMRPAFFNYVGLSPWKADIVVVKSMFPFRLYFLLQNRRTIYVRTEGTTDLDRVLTLDFDHPVHPLHEVSHWRPTDRRRRGTDCEPKGRFIAPRSRARRMIRRIVGRPVNR